MSFPLRSIVCATDLSEASDEAVRQAGAIAAQAGARLVVVSVVPHIDFGMEGAPAIPTRPTPDPGDGEPLLLSAIGDQVRRTAVRSPSELKALITRRPPYAVIVEYADQIKADLVVVGSRGGTGLRLSLLGSVAEAVVRHASCPVLVARPSPVSGRIIVATDLSDPSLPALVAADAEARRRGARLTAVHCLDLPPTLMAFGAAPLPPAPSQLPDSRAALVKDADARLRAALQEVGISGAEVAVYQGPAAAAITEHADTSSAELVVVGTHGKTGFVRLLIGSVAESVARHAPCSVLVARMRTVAGS